MPEFEAGRKVVPLTDPLHEEADNPSLLWTRTNAAEAVPGIPTPLNWTLYGVNMEKAARFTWHRMGIISGQERSVPSTIDGRFWGIFYGRASVNCDVWRMAADRTPGTTGAASEKQWFNVERDLPDTSTRRRYPIMFAKLGPAAWQSLRQVRRIRAENDAWWKRKVEAAHSGDLAAARARFREISARFDEVLQWHVLASMFAHAGYDQLERVSTKAGEPGLERRLTSGFPGMEETELMTAIWELAREQVSREEFLGRYGFHGPTENEIAGHSWREDSGPLEGLVTHYAAMADSGHPVQSEHKRVQEQAVALAELLPRLGKFDRLRARAALKIAGLYFPVRERGRAALIQTLDAARAEARRIGAELLRRREIENPEDVFYLTRTELENPLPTNVQELVEYRKERRAEYLTLTLPMIWEGPAEPIPIEDSVDETLTELVGAGGSKGVVEGRVRVIKDPSEEIEAGEILVCATTDPGWTPLFMVAAGVVVDIGGLMSHGPIVARELGLPCVINTLTGTRQLRNGDLVRIDGGTGRVAILERAAFPPMKSRSEETPMSDTNHPNATLWRTTLNAGLSGDLDTLNDCVTPDMIVHIPGDTKISGDTPLLTYLTTMVEAAGENADVDIEAVLASDDRVVAIYKVGSERNGQRLSYRAMNVYHVRDGRLAEAWINPKDIDSFNRFYA